MEAAYYELIIESLSDGSCIVERVFGSRPAHEANSRIVAAGAGAPLFVCSGSLTIGSLTCDVRNFQVEGGDSLKKVAIIVSNGSFNNLLQVSTLIRALTASLETSVRVFFRDEAVVKVTKTRINEVNLSDVVRPMEPEILRRLREAEFADLQSFLRDSKEHGDDVKLFACTSSMYMYGIREEDLIPEIDGARTLTDFLLEEVSDAEKVFTF